MGGGGGRCDGLFEGAVGAEVLVALAAVADPCGRTRLCVVRPPAPKAAATAPAIR